MWSSRWRPHCPPAPRSARSSCRRIVRDLVAPRRMHTSRPSTAATTPSSWCGRRWCEAVAEAATGAGGLGGRGRSSARTAELARAGPVAGSRTWAATGGRCWSAARPGWARPGWRPRRPAGRSPAPRVRSCSTGGARRTSACRTSPSSRRSSSYLRGSARRPRRAHCSAMVPSRWPGSSRRCSTGIPSCPAVERSDPAAERYLMFEAVVDLLARASDDQPGAAGARRPPLGDEADRPAAAATSSDATPPGRAAARRDVSRRRARPRSAR